MNNTQTTIGEKIRKYRKRAGLSQFELEMQIGASYGSMSRIENGAVNPSKETIQKIIEKLNLNTYEAANLFDIKVIDYTPLMKLSKKLYSLEKIDEIFQTAINDLVNEMNYTNGFMTIVRNNKIYSEYIAEVLLTKISLKLVKNSFKKLNVDLDNHKGNLCAVSVLEKRIIIDKSLTKFIYPAVNLTTAKALESISRIKSAIVLPLIVDGLVIGTFMVGDRVDRDLREDIEVLKEFAEHISLAASKVLYK